METLETCNLCNGKRHEIIETYCCYDHNFTFVECLDCGLAFLNPRPTVDEMGQYYADYAIGHHHKFIGPTLPVRFYYLILRKYLNARYSGSNYNILVRCLLPLELHWRWIVRCNLLYDIKKIGRVLDIGCGNGGYLAQMRLYGFECYGCEPDPIRTKAASLNEGLRIKATDLHGAYYPHDYFDVIHIWNVLEHVHDPKTVLMEANRILNQDGVLIISAPNHNSILKLVFPNWEDVPRHLFSFSLKTIAQYLEKTGFTLTHERTGGDPWAIYDRFNAATMRYLNENGMVLQTSAAEKFWKSKMRRLEYRPTRQFFSKIGAGHAFFVAAVKKNSVTTG